MSSKLSLMAMGGNNYPTFDPPFFMGANLKWFFTYELRQYGPFDDKQSAVQAFNNLLVTVEGVR